jgi:hypothetical protein
MTLARLLPAAAALFAASRAAAHGIASGAAAPHVHSESVPAWALAALAVGAVVVGLALRARSSRR